MMQPARPAAEATPIERRECEHAQEEPRRFIASNGVVHVRVQCLNCGGLVRVVKKAELRCDPDQLAEWDEVLRLSYWRRQQDERQAQYEAQREQQSAEWRAQYDGYMNSTAWWQKRERVMARDGYQCQAVLDGRCDGRAAQVHHLSYAHLGKEPLWELMAVCVPCHDAITAMDRARRGG